MRYWRRSRNRIALEPSAKMHAGGQSAHIVSLEWPRSTNASIEADRASRNGPKHSPRKDPAGRPRKKREVVRNALAFPLPRGLFSPQATPFRLRGSHPAVVPRLRIQILSVM